MWQRVFRLTPGWLIRSDWRWCQDVYLWVAARAWFEEEAASGRIPLCSDWTDAQETTL